MYYLIYCITTLIISICLFYVYAKYKLSYWSRRGVKTPPTHLIFGNFKDCVTLSKPPSKVMREIYNSADLDDPYIGFYIFHKPLLLLRDHDLIKQVMITDFEAFPNRRFGSTYQKDAVGLDSVLSIHQPRWKYLRRKVTPLMTGQKLKNMLPLLIECVRPMMNFIENLPTDEAGWKKCEVKEMSSRFSTDVMASTVFGVHTNSFKERENAFWKNGLKIFRGIKGSIIYIVFFFIPEWAPLVGHFVKEPTKFFREVFWESINTREKMGYKRRDMIDSLLTLKNEEQDPIYKFEGDNLLAQSAGLYVAGFEAMTTTLSFVLYELARHSEHQTTLYNEMQSYLSEKELTEDLINAMPFLDCVIHESLRLHPPLPDVDRIASRDYELPGTGLIIEKDVSVYVAVNATTQDPRYYPNARDFIPSRENTNNKKLFESLPFGIGPRSCIGQRLSLLITKVVLITIISNYIMCLKTTNKNEPPVGNKAIHFFAHANKGLYIQFKKRDKCAQ